MTVDTGGLSYWLVAIVILLIVWSITRHAPSMEDYTVLTNDSTFVAVNDSTIYKLLSSEWKEKK